MGTVQNPNRITTAQRYKLFKVIEDKDTQDLITQRRMNQREAAEHISQILGFTVTGNQIEQAAKDVGFQMPVAVKKGMAAVTDSLKKQIGGLQSAQENLTKTVNRQNAELAHLRMLLYHLYHEMGAHPPAGHTLPPQGNESLLGK